MPDEYKKLCELYRSDVAEDTAIWNAVNGVLEELVEELRIEFGLSRPLRAIFVSSVEEPDEDVPPRMALEATAARTWVALLNIVLSAEHSLAIDWLGAHFRFPLEIRLVADDFYSILLWPGADSIRVRLGNAESYRPISRAICTAIEAKLRDPTTQGPERIRKREIRHQFVAYYQTSLIDPETILGRTYVGPVPRIGESVAVNGGYYRVVDILWGIEDASRTWVIVVVTAQPSPRRVND